MSGTSETSTITIASLAVASSLILLTISKPINVAMMFWPGLIIALAGIGYREVHVHQEIHFPGRTREELIMVITGISRRRGWNRWASVIRSGLVRTFQIIPIALWILVVFPSDTVAATVTILGFVVIAGLTGLEAKHHVP